MAGEKGLSAILVLQHRDLMFVLVERCLGGLIEDFGSPRMVLRRMMSFVLQSSNPHSLHRIFQMSRYLRALQ